MSPGRLERLGAAVRGIAVRRVSGPHAALALVLSLCGIGFWLRATGFSHGLPHVHHPDVPKQIHALERFLDGLWVPPESIYPVLHMYLTAFLLKAQLVASTPGASRDDMVETARLLSAALATAVIPLAYLIGKWLVSRRAGLWAAGLTAWSALHVPHAHYAMGDATHVFFFTASLAAAARGLTTGRTAPLLLAGLLAGLAAAAKFYGGAVFVAVIVAAVAGPGPAPRRPLRRVGLAGALALAAFSLATPKFLDDPGAFVHRLRHAMDFGRPTMPPWLERPGVVAETLQGLALDWLGLAVVALALTGMIAMLRTHTAALALLLGPPVVVFAAYVITRASYLDDRNLLVPSVFVYLLAAAGLAWIGGRSRFRAAVALAVGLTVVGAAGVDALTVAHLFRQEDTRTTALRWAEQYLPPDTELARERHYDSEAAARSEGAVVARLLSYDYRQHLYRYASSRLEAAERAHAFFEARGKLLKRVELLPRSFTAPTVAYYDLATMDVPYAFPRPDDVVRPEPIVFVDPDALPDRASAVVAPTRAVTRTVASPEPLRQLGVALSGQGRARVTQGGATVTVRLAPGDLRVELFTPRRGFPWYKHFYPVTVEAIDGWVLARILVTPCDVAWAHLAYERFSAALPHLAACRGTRWVEPARLLDLAWAHARLGEPEPARRALDELEREAPGLLAGLIALGREPDGPAWRERYRRLVGHGPWFWHAHTFTFQTAPGPPPHELGFLARGRLATTPESRSGTLNVWFDRDFLRGPFQVRFRLRGAAPREATVARLDVVRHFQHEVLDVPVSREWYGGSDEVVLPVSVDLEPGRLEARLHYHGRGWLEVEEIAVVPDVRAALRAKLGALEPLLSASP